MPSDAVDLVVGCVRITLIWYACVRTSHRVGGVLDRVWFPWPASDGPRREAPEKRLVIPRNVRDHFAWQRGGETRARVIPHRVAATVDLLYGPVGADDVRRGNARRTEKEDVVDDDRKDSSETKKTKTKITISPVFLHFSFTTGRAVSVRRFGSYAPFTLSTLPRRRRKYIIYFFSSFALFANVPVSPRVYRLRSISSECIVNSVYY